MSVPRRFYLDRTTDITGASGTGRVADGVLWPDGTASLRWLGERPSTVHWDRIQDAEAVHGHGGHTRIVWIDPEDDKRVTDPRALGGNIAGPGGPRDRNGVIIDDTHAILLDETECALVETRTKDVVLALLLRGRINKSADRANALYLLNGDGAAALVTELIALAHRVGPEFGEALMQRIARLVADGATGS